jgi:glutathione synthase/RimK-type ligase-like ATP-grasp enzyme
MSVQSKIHVLHENAEWVVPLEAAFREQGLPYEAWFLDSGTVDLRATPPHGVFYNRMSASSHTRGHRYAPELTHAVLNWLELHGRRVVNGTRALYLEVSKVAQYAALERVGIAVPATIAAVGRDAVLAAADQLGQWPFVLKPNRGGKGLGVQLFDSMDALAAFLEDPGDSTPIDGVWLVQEYVRPERPFIIRCEFIGGRFLYAVEVDASQGFELCPADVCAMGEAVEKFRILEGFDHPVLERYARFLAENRIEVAGIELILRPDGTAVTYDVNTNTNYNARAEAAAGLYGMRELARFLGAELHAEQREAA